MRLWPTFAPFALGRDQIRVRAGETFPLLLVLVLETIGNFEDEHEHEDEDEDERRAAPAFHRPLRLVASRLHPAILLYLDK